MTPSRSISAWGRHSEDMNGKNSIRKTLRWTAVVAAALLIWGGALFLAAQTDSGRQGIARILGAVVFLMGFAFIYVAVTGQTSPGDWLMPGAGWSEGGLQAAVSLIRSRG